MKNSIKKLTDRNQKNDKKSRKEREESTIQNGKQAKKHGKKNGSRSTKKSGKSRIGGSKDEKTRNSKKGKKEKEKWIGEESAIGWTKQLASVNLISDYDELKRIGINDERCRDWASNMFRNRHPLYKCYDDNRVKIPLSKCGYINASKVNLSNFKFPRMAILAQMPKLDSIDAIEDFWKMIFNEQCSSVHIICQLDELEAGLDKLFSQQAEGYFYANSFFVNTRKVERNASEKLDKFIVELLPEGCSNAIMCQVYAHTYWKGQGGPEKFYAPIKAAQLISKTDVDSNPVAIVSLRGAGRNAALLTLSVVVSQLNQPTEPKIKEIVASIREQRPMAVDSIAQYISLYLATCWLIKAKLPNPSDDVIGRLKKFRVRCDPTSSQMSLTTFEESKDTKE